MTDPTMTAAPAKRDYITVAEAYRSERTHAICLYHYEHSDAVAYSIGPVQSARSPGYCETCDAEVSR